METNSWLIIFSTIIVGSFIFNIISKKTGIPSVLLLMFSGIIIRLIVPESGSVVDQSIMQLLGTIGLILIVLEAALDLHLKKENNIRLLKASANALILLIVGIFSIGAIFKYSYDCTWITAIIYAVPLSVMSSAIVIPSIDSLTNDKKEFMIYESSLSDILGIVIFYLCIDLGAAESKSIIATLVGLKTILTILGSAIFSYGLVYLFHKLKSEVKLFLLIAVLILIYALGKTFHLSSLILILIFGLVLNNYDLFFRGFLKNMITKDETQEITENLHSITLESAFLIKTFFFVAFGISINLIDLSDSFSIILALAVGLIIYLSRYASLLAIQGKKNILPEVFISPRGLITVLLFFAIPESFQIPEFGKGIILGVIILTNLVMTYGIIKNKKTIASNSKTDIEPSFKEGLE